MSEILDLIGVLGAVDDAVKPPDRAESPADTEVAAGAGAAPEPPGEPESPPGGSAPGPHSQRPITTAAPESEERREEQRRQLIQLVPVYDDRSNFGWFEASNQRGVTPSIGEALRNLAEPTRSPAMLPRRLLAIALAARVFPERFGPFGTEVEVSLDALTIPGMLNGLPPVVPPLPSAAPPPDDLRTGGVAGPADDQPASDPAGGAADATDPDDAPPAAADDGGDGDLGGNYATTDPELQARARALLLALADPGELTGLDDWRRFLDRFEHLVNPQLFNLPAPCWTTVVKAGDGADEVTLLQTDLCLAGADLRSVADGFLDWTRWKQFNSWWCEMADAGTSDVLYAGESRPLPRYLEKVASWCSVEGNAAPFEVAVFLDFARIDKGPDRQLLTYKMSESQSPTGQLAANDAVTVDEGVIEVRDDGDHLRVATTKRVRFADLDASVAAVLACWVGYGDVGTEMILNATGGAVRAVRCGGGGTPSARTSLLSQILALADGYVSDAAAEAHSVIDSAGSGSYGVGDALEDATSAVKLALRGWQNLASTVLESPDDGSGHKAAAVAEGRKVRSRPLAFASALEANCSLELIGPLESRHGIVATEVEIVPGELKAGGRRFHLDVETEDLPGGFLEGEVEARNAETNVVVATVPVDVIVP